MTIEITPEELETIKAALSIAGYHTKDDGAYDRFRKLFSRLSSLPKEDKKPC